MKNYLYRNKLMQHFNTYQQLHGYLLGIYTEITLTLSTFESINIVELDAFHQTIHLENIANTTENMSRIIFKVLHSMR